MIIKMTDVETHINPRNVDIGDIGSRFYMETQNTVANLQNDMANLTLQVLESDINA